MRTLPQRTGISFFYFIYDLTPLSVAITNSLIEIGLGAEVVDLCFLKSKGTATSQGRLDASSP